MKQEALADGVPAEDAAASKEVDELTVSRNGIFARYPLLSQVDPVAFAAMPPGQRAAALRSASGQVLRDIETTRGNVLGHSVDVWQLEPAVQAALVGLGVTDATFRGWALEKATWQKTKSTAFDIALGVLGVGLGIAATVVSGGLAGVALAAGALSVGVVSAASATADYFKTRRPPTPTSTRPSPSTRRTWTGSGPGSRWPGSALGSMPPESSPP